VFSHVNVCSVLLALSASEDFLRRAGCYLMACRPCSVGQAEKRIEQLAASHVQRETDTLSRVGTCILRYLQT